MSVSRKTVENSVEDQIVLAMIVSTEFNNKIDHIFRPDFMLNPYSKTVTKWCRDYFKEYRKAPGMNVKAVYELEKGNLDKAESEIIKVLLSKLNDTYVSGDGINHEYIYDKTLDYFNERELDIRLDKALKMKQAGRIKEAREVITEKSHLEKVISRWETAFDPYDVVETYKESDAKIVSAFPGILGDLIGPLERGWLFGLIGAFKRGKTFYMLDLAVHTLMRRRNVAFISLEMTAEGIKERLYKRITGLGDEDQYLFPMFDCRLNQTGECTRRERTNTVAIREAGEFIETKEHVGYQPCFFCRNKYPKVYKPDVWYEPIRTPVFSLKTVQKKIRAFSTMYGNRLRIKSYPRFSATLDDIARDLDTLEHLEGFIPDLIVVDYATIVRPGKDSSKDKRDAIDYIWKTLAQMASERHCLVVSASQGTRDSLKKFQMGETDIAEWIGILGHVDVFSAISQTDYEKGRGVIRFNVLEHRHREYSPNKSVMVLQHVRTGQTYLDSEYSR